MTENTGLCETCKHRAESIKNVLRWLKKGGHGLPCDPAPKAECKYHEGYGRENETRTNCRDYLPRTGLSDDQQSQ